MNIENLNDLETSEMYFNFISGMQNLMLRSKPHIKKYEKLRKMCDDILDNMLIYVNNGKFKLDINIDDKESY